MNSQIRVTRIDKASWVVKIIIMITLAVLIFIINTLCCIFVIKYGETTVSILIGVFTITCLWIVVYCYIVFYEKSIEDWEVALDTSGSVLFKYKGNIFKFNIPDEYTKDRVKVYKHSKCIFICYPKYRGKYKIEIYFTNELYERMLKVCEKRKIELAKI